MLDKLTIYLSTEEKQEIKEYLEKQGFTISGWVRAQMRKALEKKE